jgi:hypothetical protein
MQSAANRSPQPNSLLTGKLTGNFAEFRSSTAILMRDQRADSIAYGRFPYAKEQGISEDVSGKIFQRTGIFTYESLISSRHFGG